MMYVIFCVKRVENTSSPRISLQLIGYLCILYKSYFTIVKSICGIQVKFNGQGRMKSNGVAGLKMAWKYVLYKAEPIPRPGATVTRPSVPSNNDNISIQYNIPMCNIIYLSWFNQ